MRLFELIDASLSPGEQRPLDQTEKKLKDFIEAHCSEILAIYRATNGKCLYRGVTPNLGPVPESAEELEEVAPAAFMGHPRLDRRPLHTAAHLQAAIDKTLTAAGFTALRCNSIFCCGGKAAGEFGKVYAIFPLDGFDYTWCESAEDLTNDFGLNTILSTGGGRHYTFREDLKTMQPNEFVEKYGFFCNKALDRAIRWGNEVYITGDYVALGQGRYYRLITELTWDK